MSSFAVVVLICGFLTTFVNGKPSLKNSDFLDIEIEHLMAQDGDETMSIPNITDLLKEQFGINETDAFMPNPSETLEKRVAIQKNVNGTDFRWPNGVVVFELADDIWKNRKERETIHAGMVQWMTKTCVTFQRYNPKKPDYFVWIAATAADSKTGCWATLGRNTTRQGGIQYMSLRRNDEKGAGCMHDYVIAHEFGHTLGLHHEQTRHDRDDYLDIVLENVQPQLIHNYKKADASFMEDLSPYDYLSVMQYGQTTFGKIDAKTGKEMITMKPKDPCYASLIGKSRQISFYDAKLVNLMYNCTVGCDSSKCGPNCYSTRSGENRRCHCVCPDLSRDPCSCPLGDVDPDCARAVHYNPIGICRRYPKICCESCKRYRTRLTA